MYTTRGSDVIFGLKIYTLGIFFGSRDPSRIFLGLKSVLTGAWAPGIEEFKSCIFLLLIPSMFRVRNMKLRRTPPLPSCILR